MELFDLPLQRLDAATHAAVFGDLPAALAADLHSPEVGDLVLQLLDKGWRSGQLSARIGALPAGRDPVADVGALLRGFLPQVPPDARWRAEKAQRDHARSSAAFEEPASEQSRQRWIQQIRADLGTVKRAPTPPTRRVRPSCALCEAESDYFVTRAVRLGGACVAMLAASVTDGPRVAADGVASGSRLPEAG